MTIKEFVNYSYDAPIMIAKENKETENLDVLYESWNIFDIPFDLMEKEICYINCSMNSITGAYIFIEIKN